MSALTFPMLRCFPRFAWLRGFRCRYAWLTTRWARRETPPRVDYAQLLREIDDLNRRLANSRD